MRTHWKLIMTTSPSPLGLNVGSNIQIFEHYGKGKNCLGLGYQKERYNQMFCIFTPFRRHRYKEGDSWTKKGQEEKRSEIESQKFLDFTQKKFPFAGELRRVGIDSMLRGSTKEC